MSAPSSPARPRTDLRPLIAPASVALVGATEETSRFGGRCLQRLLEFGYRGRVYPINPRYPALRGLTCYPSVRELPEAPDHVGVVVPAERVLGILRECAERGVRFATVYTGGFAESGTPDGRALQADITAFARETGLRVMGPNCNGLINFVDTYAMTTTATIAGPRRAPGNIAVVSQSGGVGQVNVMWRAQQLGLGVSYEVSCGNSADLDLVDFGHFMVEDPHTDVILMIAEHVPEGGRFIELAQAARARAKPIVMLKFGRTAAGSRAAASHTGAVTGADEVQDAVLRQLGVIRVTDTHELYETAMMLRTKRHPAGRRLAATTVSGGNAVLLVDLAAGAGFSFPDYQPDTQERLATVLPKLGTTANPTDVTNMAIGKPDIFRRCIEGIAGDPNIDAVVPIFTMTTSGDLLHAAAAAKVAAKPVALLWTGGCNDRPEFGVADLVGHGVPVFRDTIACVRALDAAARYGEFLQRPPVTTDAPKIDRQAFDAALATACASPTERNAKAALAAYGLPVTREALARDADEAVHIASSFGGRVALKIESPDIPHKTEAGAIRLGIQGDAAVRAAYDAVMSAAKDYAPQARLDGVLVQEMIGAGVELMLGIAHDPAFGPVIVVGLGGIHVEVLRDLTYRAAPVDRAEAGRMLRELRGYRLLEGVRGQTACDVDALCATIERLSWLAVDAADRIAELDVNPLVARPDGVTVVDALIVPRTEDRA